MKSSIPLVRLLALFVVQVCLSGALAGEASSGPAVQPGIKIIAGPCLEDPTAGSMTVVWLTDKPSTGRVEYGETEPLQKRAFTSHDGLKDANERLHRVTLTGLEPGGAYRYRVVSREIVDLKPYKIVYGAEAASDVYGFTTLDPGKSSFSFIVLNDLHDHTEIMKKLLALAGRKPYDFVFFNGDIINDPQSEEQVLKAFFRPCTETFATRIPFFFVRGNHETRGRYARRLKRLLRNPEQRYYYSFDHGPVHFVVLDSGEDKEDSHRAYSGLADFDRYRTVQAAWLEKEVASRAFRDARFRIALTHIPLFGSGKGAGPSDCRRKWGGLLQKGKIDLHLSAHLHRYRILEPEPRIHDYPIAIGGAPQEGKATLMRVDVSPSELRLTMITDEDKLVGSCTVPVSGRERPEAGAAPGRTSGAKEK